MGFRRRQRTSSSNFHLRPATSQPASQPAMQCFAEWLGLLCQGTYSVSPHRTSAIRTQLNRIENLRKTLYLINLLGSALLVAQMDRVGLYAAHIAAAAMGTFDKDSTRSSPRRHSVGPSISHPRGSLFARGITIKHSHVS